MKKLSKEQVELVERYHYVIYCVLKKLSKPASEYYDVAAERLCLAARSYKGDHDKFFSYAFASIKRAVLNEGKKPLLPDVTDTEDDPWCEVHDMMYIDDVLRECTDFMTPSELDAMKRIMVGIKSRTPPEAGARSRAIIKYKRYLSGEEMEPTNRNLILTAKEREERNRKIVELCAKGYTDVAERMGVSERLVRQIYKDAGNPKEKTSAYYARKHNVDRGTVLRHSIGKKTGNRWLIEKVSIKKPYEKYSKSYAEDEIELIKNYNLPAGEVAKIIGRSANAIRIKRWRLNNDNKGTVPTAKAEQRN